MVVEEEVMNVFWSRKTLTKKQYLSSILRNRLKLLTGMVFWVSICIDTKTGKRMRSGNCS